MGAGGWNAVLGWRTKDWNQFDAAAEGGTLGDQANSMLVSRETYVWGCGKTIEF